MDDLISREVAIEAVLELDAKHRVSWKDAVIDMLDTLPSAQPEWKKGKWIPKEDRAKQEVFICSVCGGWAYSPWIGSRKNPKPNWCKYLFCPNCGAEMQMESQEEV